MSKKFYGVAGATLLASVLFSSGTVQAEERTDLLNGAPVVAKLPTFDISSLLPGGDNGATPGTDDNTNSDSETIQTSKGSSVVAEDKPAYVFTEKGSSVVSEDKPLVLVTEKDGKSAIEFENGEPVLYSKGTSVSDEKPEYVFTEKGSSVVSEDKPSVLVTEKDGEYVIEYEGGEPILYSKGTSVVSEDKPSVLVTEKDGDYVIEYENGEPILYSKGTSVYDEKPEYVFTEKGSSVVAEDKPAYEEGSHFSPYNGNSSTSVDTPAAKPAPTADAPKVDDSKPATTGQKTETPKAEPMSANKTSEVKSSSSNKESKQEVKATLPETGDSTNAMAAVGMASLVTVVGAFFRLKKENN